MIDSQSAARKPKRFAHFAAAAAVLLVLSPAAKAQGLFSFFSGGPSPYDIERRLEADGYALTGPLVRRGDVYLADVAVGRRDFERLVIDADSGRIVQRYRAQPARWRDVGPRDWDADEDDSWGPPPRPPVGLDRPGPSETLDLPLARPQPPASTRDQIARGEDAASPTVILGSGGARATSSDRNEKSKSKPRDAKRKTIAPAPAAQATNPPAPAQSAVAPTQAATPTPSASVTATAKADAGASVVAAKSPPPADTPDARAPSKSKAVNDLPVTPLD